MGEADGDIHAFAHHIHHAVEQQGARLNLAMPFKEAFENGRHLQPAKEFRRGHDKRAAHDMACRVGPEFRQPAQHLPPHRRMALPGLGQAQPPGGAEQQRLSRRLLQQGDGAGGGGGRATKAPGGCGKRAFVDRGDGQLHRVDPVHSFRS